MEGVTCNYSHSGLNRHQQGPVYTAYSLIEITQVHTNSIQMSEIYFNQNFFKYMHASSHLPILKKVYIHTQCIVKYNSEALQAVDWVSWITKAVKLAGHHGQEWHVGLALSSCTNKCLWSQLLAAMEVSPTNSMKHTWAAGLETIHKHDRLQFGVS